MSKRKPLPPKQKSSPPLLDPSPLLLDPSPPLPPGDSSTGKPLAYRGHIFTPIRPPQYEHCCDWIAADEEAFNALAMRMDKQGWELVAVVPHEQRITTANGTGTTRGVLVYWKRPKKGQQP